ncbi:cycloviolacin-o2-like motif protein [Ranid herpesvirus 3]|uniref:Cycloviolacin-o2-like motif protein n=1 Tax=Ranid herpesvirus 3 TaxID=1987509 RepID=A0A1X9T563_9VIRU|nr:cycloviolacin-o2-like motif protein [Ranid herpesvirus 3]ARR28837.1 cycloviolacin-o2-like motif protein [Ranid herpesvirus 3]
MNFQQAQENSIRKTEEYLSTAVDAFSNKNDSVAKEAIRLLGLLDSNRIAQDSYSTLPPELSRRYVSAMETSLPGMMPFFSELMSTILNHDVAPTMSAVIEHVSQECSPGSLSNLIDLFETSSVVFTAAISTRGDLQNFSFFSTPTCIGFEPTEFLLLFQVIMCDMKIDSNKIRKLFKRMGAKSNGFGPLHAVYYTKYLLGKNTCTCALLTYLDKTVEMMGARGTCNYSEAIYYAYPKEIRSGWAYNWNSELNFARELVKYDKPLPEALTDHHALNLLMDRLSMLFAIACQDQNINATWISNFDLSLLPEVKIPLYASLVRYVSCVWVQCISPEKILMLKEQFGRRRILNIGHLLDGATPFEALASLLVFLLND